MTKVKVFAAAVIGFALATGGVSAQETSGKETKKSGLFSIGGGALFIGDFGGGVEGKSPIVNVDVTSKWSYAGAGVFAFFDAAYAETSIGLWFGGGKTKTEWPPDSQIIKKTEVDIKLSVLNIGLLCKYPIALNAKTVLFPLVGIDYMAELSADTFVNSDAKDFSALWFKVGGGLDYKLSVKLYLRGEALYGIRLANRGEKYMAAELKDGKPLLGHGLTIKAALGYAFYSRTT